MKYASIFAGCALSMLAGCATAPQQQPTLTPEDIARAGQANIDRLGVESFSVLVKIAEAYEGKPDGDRALRRAMFLYADLAPQLKEQQTGYMQVVRSQTQKRITDLTGQGKTKEARDLAITALASQYGDANGAIDCIYQEPKSNPLSFKSNPIPVSTLPGLDKLDPRLITHPHICKTLQMQLLTKALGSVAARVTPFDKWNYVNNTAAPASSGTATSGPTAP